MENNFSSQIAPSKGLAVEIAEARLDTYLRENYGPLWGEENETAAEAFQAELREAYDAADTPEHDRRIG